MIYEPIWKLVLQKPGVVKGPLTDQCWSWSALTCRKVMEYFCVLHHYRKFVMLSPPYNNSNFSVKKTLSWSLPIFFFSKSINFKLFYIKCICKWTCVKFMQYFKMNKFGKHTHALFHTESHSCCTMLAFKLWYKCNFTFFSMKLNSTELYYLVAYSKCKSEAWMVNTE